VACPGLALSKPFFTWSSPFEPLSPTRAAVEEGIVAGGGSALLYATKALAILKPENND